MTNVQAIRQFFEQYGGRPVTMAEFRALTTADRAELGELAAKALGVAIDPPKA